MGGKWLAYDVRYVLFIRGSKKEAAKVFFKRNEFFFSQFFLSQKKRESKRLLTQREGKKTSVISYYPTTADFSSFLSNVFPLLRVRTWQQQVNYLAPRISLSYPPCIHIHECIPSSVFTTTYVCMLMEGEITTGITAREAWKNLQNWVDAVLL